MERNPCLNCTLGTMLDEGCCTQRVSEQIGIKVIKLKNGGTLEVCKNLERDKDNNRWYCGDYANRPPQCKAFECGRMHEDSDNDGSFGGGLWDNL